MTDSVLDVGCSAACYDLLDPFSSYSFLIEMVEEVHLPIQFLPQ
jgi:hypothetical protein